MPGSGSLPYLLGKWSSKLIPDSGKLLRFSITSVGCEQIVTEKPRDMEEATQEVS